VAGPASAGRNWWIPACARRKVPNVTAASGSESYQIDAVHQRSLCSAPKSVAFVLFGGEAADLKSHATACTGYWTGRNPGAPALGSQRVIFAKGEFPKDNHVIAVAGVLGYLELPRVAKALIEQPGGR
jgi:hypothetical protein